MSTESETMADEKTGPLDTILRTIMLEFTPLGGRVFAHHAEPGKLDRQTIELKCDATSSWLSTGGQVVIGTEKHPALQRFEDEADRSDGKDAVREEEGWRLSTIPTMISVYEMTDKLLIGASNDKKGSKIIGDFSYNERIQTSDGVVNEKWPTVHAWIGVGPDTFLLLRDSLLQFQRFDFSLGLEVCFPPDAVEPSWIGRRVKWDGKERLNVMSAVIVWKREDWSSDYMEKRRIGPEREVVQPYEAPREHVEVMNAVRRIEGAVARLAVPVWIAAGAIVGFLIFRP